MVSFMTFGPISESPNINQKKVLLQLDMWRKNGFCKTRLKIHVTQNFYLGLIPILETLFQLYFVLSNVILWALSNFLHFCILGNERMEVMKGAHLLVSRHTTLSLCWAISLYFFMAELWTRSLQFCFWVHSDLLASYNLLQQPQKRGRKLEGEEQG